MQDDKKKKKKEKKEGQKEYIWDSVVISQPGEKHISHLHRESVFAYLTSDITSREDNAFLCVVHSHFKCIFATTLFLQEVHSTLTVATVVISLFFNIFLIFP